MRTQKKMDVMDIKIEKDIPVPDKRAMKRSKYWIILDRMQVGDSVLFQKYRQAESLRNHMKSSNIPYACRRVEGGWRVWKVAIKEQA